MAESRGVAPSPLLARLLLLVMLVAGIVTMHAVTFTLGSGDGGRTPPAAATQHHPVGGHADPPATPCDGDDCGKDHTGLHGCVFIMTAIAILAGLVLLCWLGGGRVEPFAPRRMNRDGRHRQRAPPWTVPSLPELSILRV